MKNRAYRHPNGEFEIVTFVADTATARAFYRNATEVSLNVAIAGQAAAEAARPPPPKSREQKAIDRLIALNIITIADVS